MEWSPATFSTAPSTEGRLVYAVGDIHGYPDALRELLGALAADARRTRPDHRPLLVFLGDYVDRGPDSRAVIDLILSLAADGPFDVVALKGNHEAALSRFLDEPAYGPGWIANWGAATLRAYGIEPPANPDAAASEAVRRALADALPEAHRTFLSGLPLSATVGDYLFVHAGVRPGVYFTGVLTAVRLEGHDRRFIQVRVSP